MCLLQNVDVMGDALGLVIKVHHVVLDGDSVGGINDPAVVAEVHHDLNGVDQRVVRGREFELGESCVVNNRLEKGNATIIGDFVEGVTVALGGIYRLLEADFQGCCVVQDSFSFVVERKTYGHGEVEVVLVGLVLITGNNTPNNMGVCTPGVVIDFHRDRNDGFVDGHEVTVFWFYFNDGEFSHCFLEL